MALARRNHEDIRIERLMNLRELFDDFTRLPEDEQVALRSYWREQRWSRFGPPTIVQEASSTTSAILETLPESLRASEPAKEVVEQLHTLLADYRANHLPPRERRSPAAEEDMDELVDRVRDIEVLIDPPPSEAEPGVSQKASTTEDEAPSQIIDDALLRLMPAASYTEAPQQTALTDAEGAIIEDLMGVSQIPTPSPEAPTEVMEPQDTRSSTKLSSPELIARVGLLASDPTPPLVKLDQLINFAPGARASYDNALRAPSKQDHEHCKELMRMMGVPVITAAIPYEAEGLASSLAKAGLVDFVGTDDSDVIGYEVSMGDVKASTRRRAVS